MKITDRTSLQAEKARLLLKSKAQEEILKADVAYLKREYNPLELINKAAAKVVPAPLRRSDIINVPINFVAKNLFKKNHNVVSTESDRGKGNQVRNIALGMAEGIGAWLMTRYIRKKL